MWKFSRNIVIFRWHVNKQHSVESNIKTPLYPKQLSVLPATGEQRYSDDHQQKENYNKQSKRFWHCDQFLLSKSLLLETAGWLGTVTVLCFNWHRKHYFSLFNHDKARSHCIFPRSVLAMPSVKMDKVKTEKLLPEQQPPLPVGHTSRPNVSSDEDITEDLRTSIAQYTMSVYNSSGLSCLDSNSKKAFRSFQAAARLGSTQGLYNLGLCYEFGKGTRVNLTRAAFCYRKAAMKGHGLASFNLAIFFLKGLGGLPVDLETAKLLLAEAADKNVPEAQIYMGLECLEEEKWSEAYEIFSCLAQKNIPDGKYFLGLCFENGWGIKKDVKMATEIYSQAAITGHSKSILGLSRCYAEGLEGCDTDLDFAIALCQVVAEQGDEEGRKALLKLKLKKEYSIVKELLQSKLPPLKTGRSRIYNSSSVPEFTADKISRTKSSLSSATSYLDLVAPLPPLEAKEVKPKFYLGDDNLNLLSGAYIMSLNSKLVPAMVAKS